MTDRVSVPDPLPVRGLLPALTGSEAASWDRRAITGVGVPEPVLMENAGRGAAVVVQRLYPDGPVVGFVGAGNNGGDTLVALRSLAAWGREVHAVLVADRQAREPLLHGWPVAVHTDAELGPEGVARLLATAGVVLDGVLGTGVRGAPRTRQAEAVRAMNACGRPVLALDVPSGIDPATGAILGEAVRAAVTVAFGAPKVGSLFHPARARTGRLVVVEIGFPPMLPGEAAAFLVTPQWARAQRPSRDTDTHKNAVGRVTVIGGGVGMAGAAVLASRGALRAGAGVVRVCTVPENRTVIQTALPEAIWVDASNPAAIRRAVEGSDAVVAGPGLGTDAAARLLIETLAEGGVGVPTLLDADALNVAAAGGLDLAAIGRNRPLLLTPHPGEMTRLLGDVGGDGGPPARARAAAARFCSAVILKGAPSTVADPEGVLLIDTQGSSDLASAGMGDTLAGVCGTLMAQGLSPARAGAVGLYLTGQAARRTQMGVALTPSDVLDRLPEVLAEAGPAGRPHARPRGRDRRRGGVRWRDLTDLPFVVYDAPEPW